MSLSCKADLAFMFVQRTVKTMMIPLWLFLPVTLLAQNAAGRPLPVPSAMFIPLDSNAVAFKLTSSEAGVAFDIDGDGDLDQVAWTEAGASVALLALDVNGDGRITSGKEVFGSHMRPGARNGCNALLLVFEATGAPLSAAVHAGHKLYEQLLLWVDRNHNGISDPGELRPAKEVFTAIGLGFLMEDRRDPHGNRFRFKGWTEVRTGGPEQGTAMGLEQRQRLPYFEVALTTQ